MTDQTTQVQDGRLAAAVALGWRIAELYSRVDDPGDCNHDTLLPAHGSLERADQLELQLRAAAGDAERAGVKSDPAKLEPLVEIARRTAEGEHSQEEFRDRLRHCHVEIDKDLWALDECLGKAYELGNGLSDTYGRICRAYREDYTDQARAWADVFDKGRIERLKKLLDDLQSRLDQTAVAVVHEQLDAWRREVCTRLDPKAVDRRLRDDELPGEDFVREHLRKQTVIWRQLIAGDKRAEAYLGAAQRAAVRDRLRRLVWQRYGAWVLPLAGAVAALLFLLPRMTEWYQASVPSEIGSIAVAAIGALGISRASFVLAVRGRLHDLTDLLWHRAVVSEVVEATLTVEEVFRDSREPRRMVAARKRAADLLRPSPPPQPADNEAC
jgi:hypothetical protein